MKKVIAFSLWGNDPRYLGGAIQNISLAKIFYPDWTCRFYLGQSTVANKKFVAQIKTNQNVEIQEMNEDGNWTSEFMTHEEAFAMSEEFNEQGLYGGNAPGSWLMFALLSFGYPFEELQKWQNKNLPWKSLIRKKLRMIQEYKKTLYNVLEIS